MADYILSYYQQIKDGSITAGQLVIKAYAYVVHGLERKDFVYKPKKANEAISWIQKNCYHTEGDMAMKRLKLELWQKAALAVIFGIYDKKGIETYLKEQGFTKCKQPRKYDRTKYTGKEFCKVLQAFGKDPATYGNEIGDGIISAPRIVASIGGHHITAIINGKVNDIWDCTGKSIGNYWFKA